MDFIAFKRYVNNVTSIIRNPRKRSSYFFFLVYWFQPQAWTRFLLLFTLCSVERAVLFTNEFYHPYNKRIFIGTLILRLISIVHRHTRRLSHIRHLFTSELISVRKTCCATLDTSNRSVCILIFLFTFDYRGKKKRRKWIFEIINNLFVMLTRA